MDMTPQQFRAQLMGMVDDTALIEAAVAQYQSKWRTRPTPKPERTEQYSEANPWISETARIEGAMQKASATMLAVLRGQMPAPAGLRWASGSGGWNQHLSSAEEGWREVMDRIDAEALARRPDREPCPRCGARGDYQCGHAKVPGGRLVTL